MTWKPPCDGLTELFFSGEDEDVRMAKSICNGLTFPGEPRRDIVPCPRADECLSLALEHHRAGRDAQGVWGGKTERERLTLVDKIDRRRLNGGHGPKVEPSRTTLSPNQP